MTALLLTLAFSANPTNLSEAVAKYRELVHAAEKPFIDSEIRSAKTPTERKEAKANAALWEAGLFTPPGVRAPQISAKSMAVGDVGRLPDFMAVTIVDESTALVRLWIGPRKYTTTPSILSGLDTSGFTEGSGWHTSEEVFWVSEKRMVGTSSLFAIERLPSNAVR